ncbi:TPA: hypothetical protein N0F65_004054 [Lagenidium giganteum]|uniref:Uncharacterized protein n=1 Tax=Lagenidium giganteum TaxID=4803 RepID=A0AAV2YYF1_9STRA|nr:TPA: hypothetical protein N0F65_004054 [Lagenidium giganteum]
MAKPALLASTSASPRQLVGLAVEDMPLRAQRELWSALVLLNERTRRDSVLDLARAFLQVAAKRREPDERVDAVCVELARMIIVATASDDNDGQDDNAQVVAVADDPEDWMATVAALSFRSAAVRVAVHAGNDATAMMEQPSMENPTKVLDNDHRDGNRVKKRKVDDDDGNISIKSTQPLPESDDVARSVESPPADSSTTAKL